MTVYADTEDSVLSLDQDGYKISRVFVVDNITGNADARLKAAFDAVGIAYGTAHPSLSGIFATDFNVEVIDPSTYRVVVNYEFPTLETQTPDDTQTPTIQVGSSLVSAQTNKDKDGNQITVSITTAGGATLTQTGTVEIQVPQTIIELQRKETASPITKSRDYTGRVNSVTWNGWNPRELLMLSIEGVSNDGGVSYDVTYRLQYNPNTWDADIVFIDEATDQPHVDIDISTLNGIVTERIYPEIDFGPLNIAY